VSDAYGPLQSALRRAEARGLDVDTALPQLTRAHSLANSDNAAAVIHERVERWIDTAGSRHPCNQERLIAGFIPKALNISDPDMARALNEREQALESRARTLAKQAIREREPWVRHLGGPPTDPTNLHLWKRRLSAIAAYRDRWSIDASDKPLGSDDPPKTIEQLRHKNALFDAAGPELRSRIASNHPSGRSVYQSVSAADCAVWIDAAVPTVSTPDIAPTVD
jgi:hypothetical protein